MTPEIHPREQRLLEKQKVDAELTKARTELVRLRSQRDSMTIAMRKGELIRRFDVKLQLSLGLSAMRQRLMSFSYALGPRLEGKTAHEIRMLLDQEVRSALADIAAWPDKLGKPDWDEAIDSDLRPPTENAGPNGDADAIAQRERANSKRRAKYAKAKEG